MYSVVLNIIHIRHVTWNSCIFLCLFLRKMVFKDTSKSKETFHVILLWIIYNVDKVVMSLSLSIFAKNIFFDSIYKHLFICWSYESHKRIKLLKMVVTIFIQLFHHDLLVPPFSITCLFFPYDIICISFSLAC